MRQQGSLLFWKYATHLFFKKVHPAIVAGELGGIISTRINGGQESLPSFAFK